MSAGKQKVVILGSGVSALTTAYQLTSAPDWKDRYESITVYQMGWRLGGKCASGRLPDGRNLEHGLHIWMGWYYNAFAMIQQVYGELGRPPGAALATWEEAFRKHELIVFGERVRGSWTAWPTWFGQNDAIPGKDGEFLGLGDFVTEALDALVHLFERMLDPLHTPRPAPSGHHGFVDACVRCVRDAEVLAITGEEMAELGSSYLALRDARDRAKQVRGPTRAGASLVLGPSSQHDEFVAEKLDQARQALRRHFAPLLHDDGLRRVYLILETAITASYGVVRELGIGFEPRSFDRLDDQDFRAFLAKWGADSTITDSALVLAFYDLLFAYRDGDPEDQKVATGVALRFMGRMLFTYKGAIFWKMQAGMGDTIFVPLYEVLRKRGVRFEFFHRVRNLALAPDGKSVASIELGRQASPKSGEYQPFVTVERLSCWPAQPLYDQLVEGEELRERQIDLESLWTPWVERETPVVLEKGKDFDAIVFGISLGGIPFFAPELVAASPRWKAMVERIETVRTQAVQLWLTRSLEGLGWEGGSAVADAYPEPLNTWADMTHLLPMEGWSGTGAKPETLTYYCAPMRGGIPVDDPDAPAHALETVRGDAVAWLEQYGHLLYPKGTDPANPSGLDWGLLLDPAGRTGVARFDNQFCRANIDPSERYVLSVPGSTRYRIRADERDFDNLFPTGDWIYTGVNAGCVEGSVMAGMLTANAMCGYPKLEDIVGLSDP